MRFPRVGEVGSSTQIVEPIINIEESPRCYAFVIPPRFGVPIVEEVVDTQNIVAELVTPVKEQHSSSRRLKRNIASIMLTKEITPTREFEELMKQLCISQATTTK